MNKDKEKSSFWFDMLVLAASLIVIALSAVWMLNSGLLTVNLAEDTKLSWHLVRSSGIVAYVLLLGSTIWGLFMSAQLVKDWSPGPVSMTIHSTISWLALILGLIHAMLLMFDSYFNYTLGDLFIPFIGPYRPEAVGLGTLAFWIIVLVTLSFPFKKQMGHTAWKRLHYASYAAFVMVSAHGLFAGTEGTHLGLRLLIGSGLLVTMGLLSVRIYRSQNKPINPAKPTLQKTEDRPRERVSARRQAPLS